jgi:hypothetical protein
VGEDPFEFSEAEFFVCRVVKYEVRVLCIFCIAASADFLLSLTMLRVRRSQSSSPVGLFFSLSSIGSASVSRSAASIWGASLYRARIETRSLPRQMAWFSTFLVPCRSELWWSQHALTVVHKRAMSVRAQMSPEWNRRSSLRWCCFCSR